ncbi:hypothetical protein JL722_10038 [Aureococcus anophagefferens]|nr:hypothetical protein JL722_10038 [Aureococcus anophagefferens]
MADSPARTPPSARRPRSGSRSRGSRGSRPSSARSARSGASGKSDGDGLDDNVLAMLNIERTSSRNASRERDAKNPRRADAAAAGTNILSDAWDAASAERRASAHASSVTERAHMLAHALTFSRSPQGGTVSRRLEGLGMIDTEVADALDPRTDGTLAGLDDLGDFAGEGGAPRGGGPRPRSRSPGIATSESDGEVSLLSRGDSAPMLGLAALVLLKAKAKKMANRARKRVKAKKKVSIQDGTRGRKRKGDRNSSSRDRASRPGSRGRRGDRAPSAERADRSESPPEPWGEEHGAARAKRARSPPAADGPRDGPRPGQQRERNSQLQSLLSRPLSTRRDARHTRESGGGFESLGGGEPRPDNASWVLSDDLSYSSASRGARPATPPEVVAIPHLDAPSNGRRRGTAASGRGPP